MAEYRTPGARPDPAAAGADPYDGLAADTDLGHRWAFGTGFSDPLQDVDSTVPDGVDLGALADYCLMLGDDALVLSHRLQQWLTRLPELEEETAVANVALDLLGQASLLLARAAAVRPDLGDEDRLAFFREPHQFRNVRLVERPDADFAELVGRLLVVSAWRLAVFEMLCDSADPMLAAIAAKGVKELTYHRDYAARWVVRLGAGTEISRRRMRAALAAIWPLVPELFATHPVERSLAGIAVPAAAARTAVDEVLAEALKAGGLDQPETRPLGAVAGRAGRDGVHTEAFGYLLAELQSVARAHPEATW